MSSGDMPAGSNSRQTARKKEQQKKQKQRQKQRAAPKKGSQRRSGAGAGVGAGAGAGAGAARHERAATRRHVCGVGGRRCPSMHEVVPDLWLGSRKAAENHKLLRKKGVVAVLSVGCFVDVPAVCMWLVPLRVVFIVV